MFAASMAAVGILAMGLAAGTRSAAQDAGPNAGAGTASDAEIEVLRKLLGVPAAAAPAAAPAAEEEQGAAPSEARDEAPEVAPEEARPARTEAPVKKPSASKKAPPRSKPAVVTAPKRGASKVTVQGGKPTKAEAAGAKERDPAAEDSATSSTATSTTSDSAATTVSVPTTAGSAAEAPAAAAEVAVDLPPSGSEVSSQNVERWKPLLGPSIQWSIARGVKLDVVDATPIPLEAEREAATQRYHAQVELAPDKRSMRDYVAGIPFPFVDDDDPDAAPKLMFNMENRINQDDLDIRNVGCDTGSLDARNGFELQRHYLIDHFRRLYSVGRIWVDPKPENDPQGVRYREMLYPLREPFDLQGAGFTYVRYLDPNRQDDSWLYLPQLKRVRRLGTAQRSEGIFGQDVDLDSYGGFAGNPAWTSWTYLGKKTILASMHARHMPSPFQEAPANFFPDDVWEPREVHVILGISKLGGYNFGRRIIYLDRETWIIPYTEIYDLKGRLWRSLIHTWRHADTQTPTSKLHYGEGTPYIAAFTLIDMQLEHATRCQFPAEQLAGDDAWFYRFGAKEGNTEDVYAVSNFIGTGH